MKSLCWSLEATGEVRGVESLESGGVGVAPLIFSGDRGDLRSLSSWSECLELSEWLLSEELGLESPVETDLGVSALEEGLEELFFLGEDELSL